MSKNEKEYTISEIFVGDIDAETRDSVQNGVMSDDYNYVKLTGAIASIIIATLFLIILMVNMFGYYKNQAKEQSSLQTEYTEISTLQSVANERLQSVGIIDKENGVYHIPIDDAINLLSQK